MQIGNKTLNKPYIIAEAGVNHNGSLDRARELIQAAAEAGCDAIKFQTYTADELVCKNTPKFWDWEGDKDKKTQYDAYAAIGGFPYSNYPTLLETCQEHGIEFLSTPFSLEAADFLNDLGMAAFKVASSDMSHLPFLEHIAQYHKPILLSTGASTMDEVREAVETIKKYHDKIIVMHCTLCYPTKPEDANLNIIKTLQHEFPDLTIGLSDHTLEYDTAGVAVAAGAMVLEKHFTVDKTLGESADHWLSLDQAGMTDYVSWAHNTFKVLGSGDKVVYPCEKGTRLYDKRSIVSRVEIPKGTKITKEMLDFKRPGTGIEPKWFDKVVNKIAKQNIPEDVPLQWIMF